MNVVVNRIVLMMGGQLGEKLTQKNRQSSGRLEIALTTSSEFEYIFENFQRKDILIKREAHN